MKHYVLLIATSLLVAACSSSSKLSYPEGVDAPTAPSRVVASSTTSPKKPSPWERVQATSSQPEIDSTEIRLLESIRQAGLALKKELSSSSEPTLSRDEWLAALLAVPTDQEIARRDQLIEQIQPYMPLAENEGSLEEAARQLAAYQRTNDLSALQQAIKELEGYVQRYPADARARLYLSRAYRIAARLAEDSGLEEKALDQLRRLLYLNAGDVAAWVDMARLLERQDKLDAAGYAWEMAARSQISADNPESKTQALRLYVQALRTYARAGYYSRALLAIGEAQALVSSPEDSQLVADERAWLLWDGPAIEHRLVYDELIARAENLDAAGAQALLADVERLAQQVSTWRARVDIYRLLGYVYHTAGQTDEAIKQLRPYAEVIKKLPETGRNESEQRLLKDYAALLTAEAQQLIASENREAAARLLIEAGELNLGAQSAEALLAAAQLYRPVPDQALALLDRVNPDQLEDKQKYFRLRFEVLRALGRFDEAKRIYELVELR